MLSSSYSVYTDGGARGNPGPAACAYLIYQGATVIDRRGLYMGIKTNNEAEYQGVIEALRSLAQLNLPPSSAITFYSDSQLIVNQLKGLYKIKEPRLALLAAEARNLLTTHSLIPTFIAIPREQNKLADALVNQTLDANKNTGILEA